jgi:hypothetical protein
MLAQYPEVAEADSINPIPRFNFRKPRSLIQFLLVLFCRTTLGSEVSAIISTEQRNLNKEKAPKPVLLELSSSFYLKAKD